jgi:hypothetical protein
MLISMKRLLQSLVGGVAITCLLMVSLLLLGLATVPTMISSEVWEAFAYFLRWPHIILGPYFPPEYTNDPSAPFIRTVLMAGTLACNVLLYSALTYVFLKWRGRRVRLATAA